jgi:nitric oxide reductase large subunit
MSETLALAPARRSPWPAILAGGLAVAALDAVFFTAFWAPQGVPPTRILQTIASGLLGTASFQGGAGTAWLGAGLHCFIATMMVLTYYLVGTRVDALLRHPARYGLPYGLLLYGVMNYIVLPLSNAPQSSKINLAWMLSSIAMHMVFGVMCAWFARKARRAWAGT